MPSAARLLEDIACAEYAVRWALVGKLGDAGEADIAGSYSAPPGPDWGWRVVVHSPQADSFLLEMFNRSPDGQEDLAVRLRLVRTRRDSER